MMAGTRGLGIAHVLLVMVGMVGCGPRATVVSRGGPSIQAAQVEAYNGPKARIAVAAAEKTYRMEAIGSTHTTTTSSDEDRQVANMLATALFNTNRFIVLERQNILALMKEQDMATAGRIRGDTAVPTGDMEGAELLITCALTKEARNTGGVRTIVGGVDESNVALDLRIMDTRTSRIVAAATVEGRSSSWRAGVPLVAGGYGQTPREDAIRAAVEEGVRFVVGQTPPQYYHR